MPRRWTDLNTLKVLFYKLAETLGVDGGGAGSSISHAQKVADYPVYSRMTTGATAGFLCYSYGLHAISRLQRLPSGGVPSKLVFEARAILEQTADVALSVGFASYSALEGTNPCAQIFSDSAVGLAYQTRTYQAAEEQTNTGVTVDTSWHTFKIECVSGRIDFFIDGSAVSSHSTQVPNAGLMADMQNATINLKTNAAASKYARYSYVAIWLE